MTGFTIAAHEPYYIDYTKMDLAATFSASGFTVEESAVHWVTKTVTATKSSLPPLVSPPQPAEATVGGVLDVHDAAAPAEAS